MPGNDVQDTSGQDTPQTMRRVGMIGTGVMAILIESRIHNIVDSVRVTRYILTFDGNGAKA